MAGATDLLTRAEAAYQAAVADPAKAGPVAEVVVAEARRAGDVEAEVVALRAQAWCAVRAQLAEGVPGACSTGRLGWPRRQDCTNGWRKFLLCGRR